MVKPLLLSPFFFSDRYSFAEPFCLCVCVCVCGFFALFKCFKHTSCNQSCDPFSGVLNLTSLPLGRKKRRRKFCLIESHGRKLEITL